MILKRTIDATYSTIQGMGRAAYAIKSFKAGDLVGCMYGRFSTDFQYSNRVVEVEALKYRFKVCNQLQLNQYPCS